MSFAAFWSAITKNVPSDPPSGLKEALAGLNPDKIYLENVRSVLGVSASKAQRICETAVRQGLFQKMVEVVCPDGSIAASAENEHELPRSVTCWREKGGNTEPVEIATTSLSKTVYYRLNG